jgi:amino acid transporter
LVLSWVVRQLLTAVIVIRVALILTGSADILRRHTKRGNNMTQNTSDRLTKLFPIAFVATAAIWLVVILITDFPAWTLAVYVALGIPAVKYFSRSDKNDQPN